MQRYFFKLTMYLVVIAGLANYFIYFATGRVPFLDLFNSTEDLSKNLQIPSIPEFNTKSLPKVPGLNATPDRAFKWTDSNGVTHFSDQAPDGQDAKLIQLESEQPAPEESTTTNDTKKSKKIFVPGRGEIDLDAIKQQLQDAQNTHDAALKEQ